MQNSLICWKCGASLAHLSLPLTRQDECRACHAALHACKLCKFYDIAVAKHCRETIAEEVRDKDRANYCDYFAPREAAYSNSAEQQAAAAKAQLDALFGGAKNDSGGAAPVSAADKAKAELEKLFGKN